MFDKTILMHRILNTFRENNYETFVTHGSFDVVAKREHLLLIKTLLNVDAFDESHAMDLRAMSHFLSAYPFVVSLRNNREHLDDEVIYSRFKLPVITPALLQMLVEEDEIEVAHSSKGRHTQEINVFELKEKRKELELTLDELAGKIGVSKKAMYEIENKRVNPQKNTVKKLEIVLGIDLILPYEMKQPPAAYLRPRDQFQKTVSIELSRLGIDNSAVYSAPFELVGKEDFSLITNLSTTPSEAKKEITEVKQLSQMFSSKAVLISKRTLRTSVEGVSIVSEPELTELKNSRELGKVIDERS